jgi:cell division protein FtsA
MDTRIGHPDEHLSKGAAPELSSPLYATAVGLLMKGIAEAEKRAAKNPRPKQEETPVLETKANENLTNLAEESKSEEQTKPTMTDQSVVGHSKRQSASWLTGLTEKFTNWLEDE